jgi:long-chain acyl-CoA synthetase
LVRHYDTRKHDISSLEYGISGGSYMPVELNRLIKEKMNLDIIQGYGLTECQPVTCNYLTTNRPDTLGVPLHGVQVRIVDEDGRDCEVGHSGEILIKTLQTTAGYYGNKDDSMRVLRRGWLHTGDCGRLDKEGYLYFEGLKKRIIKVAGNVVDIAEVRRLILSLKRVENLRLDIGHDCVKGHYMVITVSVAGNADGLAKGGMVRFLRKHLSLYKLPAKVFVQYNTAKTD